MMFFLLCFLHNVRFSFGFWPLFWCLCGWILVYMHVHGTFQWKPELVNHIALWWCFHSSKAQWSMWRVAAHGYTNSRANTTMTERTPWWLPVTPLLHFCVSVCDLQPLTSGWQKHSVITCFGDFLSHKACSTRSPGSTSPPSHHHHHQHPTALPRWASRGGIVPQDPASIHVSVIASYH